MFFVVAVYGERLLLRCGRQLLQSGLCPLEIFVGYSPPAEPEIKDPEADYLLLS